MACVSKVNSISRVLPLALAYFPITHHGTAQRRLRGTRLISSNSSKEGDHSVLKSILYGSDVAKREELELEQSYGKVLARGKYVHEIVRHSVYPGKVMDYINIVGQEYPHIAADPKNDVHLVGSWCTQVGDLDRFTHIWEYRGCMLSGIKHSRTNLA